MNDYPENLIVPASAGRKNRFPIVAQLGILSVIFIGLFGTYLWQAVGLGSETPPAPQEFVTDTKQYPLTPQKIEGVSLKADAVYVWDVRSQQALYSKNAEEELPLASITKLMTALLAYELISEKETVSIPISAIKQEGSSGLSPGELLKTEDLLELALVSSSNDAAYALAASVGELLGNRDPADQFIRGMNIRAEELGFSSLNFKNTTGLDLSPSEAGATGNARDVSFLLEYIINKYPEIIESTKKPVARIYNSAGTYHEADNTNEFVSNIPNLIGSKTGFTDLAGGNLTIAFDAGLNRPIIITVLGSTREGRFEDVMKLIEKVQETIGKQQ